MDMKLFSCRMVSIRYQLVIHTNILIYYNSTNLQIKLIEVAHCALILMREAPLLMLACK
jgi:hypothetical protein